MNIWLILALVFAALEALALRRGWDKLEYVAKPAVMVCLFVWLYCSTGLQGLTIWFGLGLLFSLAGDVLLMISLDRMFVFGSNARRKIEPTLLNFDRARKHASVSSSGDIRIGRNAA